MIELRLVEWNEIASGVVPLLFAHVEELGIEHPIYEIDPDHELLQRLSESGGLLIVAAYLQDEIVGYITWYVAAAIEYRGRFMASQGPWFVAKPHRNGSIATRLWKRSLEELRSREVFQVVAHNYSNSPRGLEKFFVSQGGIKMATFWSIYLEVE